MSSPTPASSLPRHGDLLEVRLTGLDDDGLATARLDWQLTNETRRLKLIVRGGIPGDLVLMRAESRQRDTVHGRMLSLIEPSPHRTTPACRHARYEPDTRHCGGCTLQAMSYEGQLELKRQRVVKAFEVHGLDPRLAPVGPIVAAPKVFGHRHKMELSFASDRREDAPGPTLLGLHPPGLKWEVIPLEECRLTSPAFSAFLPTLRAIFARSGLIAWDPRDERGFLRNLVVREGQRSAQRLVEILTTPLDPVPLDDELVPAAALMDRLAIEILDAAQISKIEISSLLWTVHDAARGRPTRYRTSTLHGASSLTEELLVPAPAGERRLTFEVAPRAFFQPHPLAAENVIRQIHARLPSSCRTLLDLYCGTGTLALALAPNAESVLGIELVPEAVESARTNAARNGLEHCSFIAGDVDLELARLRESAPERLATLDAVLLDPPRQGLNPRALETLVALRPPRIVYVSCRPESLARDLRLLMAQGYRLDGEATPVDLFPQTHHVETVVALVAT